MPTFQQKNLFSFFGPWNGGYMRFFSSDVLSPDGDVRFLARPLSAPQPEKGYRTVEE